MEEPLAPSVPLSSPPPASQEELAARLSAILNTAVDGIITIGETGIIESANPAARQIFGYTDDELIGRNVSMLMPEPYHSQHDRYLSHHRETGERKIIGIGREVTGLRKDGSVFPMDLSVSEVLLPGRRLFTGFVRDISARKEQNARLLASTGLLDAKNKELESIVHVASHDLRAPLVNISGFSRELSRACERWEALVAEEPMSDALRGKLSTLVQEEVREPLGFILASVTKIDRLLGGLLILSRLGHAALKIDRVEMNHLVKEVLSTLEYQIKAASAQVLTGAMPDCYGDAVQLNQVLSNLVDNAIKYRHPTRPLQIEITGEAAGGEAFFHVRDNGLGIPPEQRQMVFEIFQRLDPSRSDGEGLGLAIAQRIVQRLGGRIGLDSGPEGGCTFHIVLPLALSNPP